MCRKVMLRWSMDNWERDRCAEDEKYYDICEVWKGEWERVEFD
jgi:hypothetical protein